MSCDRLLLPVVLLATCGMSPPTAQPADVPISTTQPSQTPKPVTFVVVDAVTKQPVADFSYLAIIRVPTGWEEDWRRWMLDWPRSWEKLLDDEGDSRGWVAVKSVDGTFTLDAPASCQISLRVYAPGYVTDDRSRDYPVRSADSIRRFLHEIDQGTTLRGKVVDEETGKPIQGVQISPTNFRDWPPEDEPVWRVATDENGLFEISGAYWGILARHPSYVQGGFSIPIDAASPKRAIDDLTISLHRAGTMTGVVRDPTGKPVEGACVGTDYNPCTQTNADGSFVLGGMDPRLAGRAFTLCVGKSGFMDERRQLDSTPRETIEVTLRPLFEIRGRVFDPEGKPVRSFSAMAGQRRYPPNYNCERVTVDDAEGRFAIGIETSAMDADRPDEKNQHIEREHWVGVKADGFAAWEGWVTYAPEIEPLSVTLSRGVAVSGGLVGIGEQLDEGEAVLLPEYWGTEELRLDVNAAQQFATLRVPIGKDGRFHFDHVRPCRYTLIVGGKRITPKVVPIEVPPGGRDVGVVEVESVGRVVGQAFTHQCVPWAFGFGAVQWRGLGGLSFSWFRLDENGCFDLKEVPAGKRSVGIMNGGGCMVTFDSQEIEVIPGETTPLVINDPETGDVARFRLVVGDGSERQRRTGFGDSGVKTDETQDRETVGLELKLTQLTTRAANSVDEREHYLRDNGDVEFVWRVSPGEYRLRLSCWEDSRHEGDGVVYDSQVRVEPGKKVIDLQLGAGAIKGRMAIERLARYQPKVIAVEVHGRTHARRVQCSEEDGSFCLRYLPPGEYALYAHKEAQGWGRLPPVKVKNEVIDVGQFELKPGGTIRGSVLHHLPTVKRAAVRMVEASGAFLDPIGYGGYSGEEFIVLDVWPGEWTVRAECEGKVIAEQKVVLKGTETVRADLIAENE